MSAMLSFEYLLGNSASPIRAPIGKHDDLAVTASALEPGEQRLIEQRFQHAPDGPFLVPGKNPDGNGRCRTPVELFRVMDLGLRLPES